MQVQPPSLGQGHESDRRKGVSGVMRLDGQSVANRHSEFGKFLHHITNEHGVGVITIPDQGGEIQKAYVIPEDLFALVAGVMKGARESVIAEGDVGSL